MAEMKWTKEQQQVIDARGRNLLVRAAERRRCWWSGSSAW